MSIYINLVTFKDVYDPITAPNEHMKILIKYIVYSNIL